MRSLAIRGVLFATLALSLAACGDNGGGRGGGRDSGTGGGRDSGGGGGDDGGGGGGMDSGGGGGGDGGGEECVSSSCGDCTGMGACGWCASTSTCMVGGSDGPEVGTCEDWDYIRSDCADYDAGPPPDCSMGTTCETCTPMGGCGFCASTMTCMNGSGTGPTEGSCADWRWVTSECEMPLDCPSATDCGMCTSMSRCGWCPGRGCLLGTGDGPAEGTCAMDAWAWLGSECPM